MLEKTFSHTCWSEIVGMFSSKTLDREFRAHNANNWLKNVGKNVNKSKKLHIWSTVRNTVLPRWRRDRKRKEFVICKTPLDTTITLPAWQPLHDEYKRERRIQKVNLQRKHVEFLLCYCVYCTIARPNLRNWILLAIKSLIEFLSKK